MNLVRYADRPDLLERRYRTLSAATFPEFLQHNDPGNLYWGRLYEDFPAFQVALSTARISSPRRTRCRSPGTDRWRICPQAGTRLSSAG